MPGPAIVSRNRWFFGACHLVHTFVGNMRRSTSPTHRCKSRASQIVTVIVSTAHAMDSSGPRESDSRHTATRGGLSDLSAKLERICIAAHHWSAHRRSRQDGQSRAHSHIQAKVPRNPERFACRGSWPRGVRPTSTPGCAQAIVESDLLASQATWLHLTEKPRPRVSSADSSRTTLTDAICGIRAACSRRTAGRPH